jgi:hypothetical protein
MNGNPSCTNNLSAGFNPNVSVTRSLPSGDLWPDVTVQSNPANQIFTASDQMPAGTKLGGIHSDMTIGAFNGACEFFLAVDWVLFNIPEPNVPGNPRFSGNIAWPQPKGTPDRFGRWQVGSEPIAGGGTALTAGTYGANIADSTNIPMQNYPSYLLDYLDPDFIPGVSDGPLNPIVPTAVYGGLTKVVTDWWPVYVIQMPSGAMDVFRPPLGYLGGLDAGQTELTVSWDPTVSSVDPYGISSITDWCTPSSSTTMLLGVDQSMIYERVQNPIAGGTVIWREYDTSLRDLDEDGYENYLDTCPKIANLGNPRIVAGAGNGDNDADGIDNACDTVNNPGVTDQDGDGYYNRQDNCPQNANAGAAQVDGEFIAAATPNADLGPRSDEMGDICDTGMVTVGSQTITLSPTVANGKFITSMRIHKKCIAGVDGDTDGICDVPTSESIGPSPVSSSGGTVTTGSTPTLTDPLESSVAVPGSTSGGTVTILESSSTVVPGYSILGQQALITTTVTGMTPTNPLTLTFTLDGSVIPPGFTQLTIAIFKNNALIPNCTTYPGATTAVPDPCVSNRIILAGGDIRLLVKSSGASTWKLGVACPGPAKPWQAAPGDRDCDGFPDSELAPGVAAESYLGTEAGQHCAANSGANNEASPDAWPPDFNDNQIVNGQDVGKFAGAYGNTVAGGPYGTPPLPGERFDFNGNGIINGQDIGKYAFYYGLSCV